MTGTYRLEKPKAKRAVLRRNVIQPHHITYLVIMGLFAWVFMLENKLYAPVTPSFSPPVIVMPPALPTITIHNHIMACGLNNIEKKVKNAEKKKPKDKPHALHRVCHRKHLRFSGL
jgi:hypothetical protein